MVDIIKYLISAIVGAAITYIYTRKSTRFGFVFKEKLEAYKVLNKTLSDLDVHCSSELSSLEGNEFGYESLEQGSALVIRQKIHSTISENKLFIGESVEIAFEQLDGQLSLLCNVELIIAGAKIRMDENEMTFFSETIKDGYRATLLNIRVCQNALKL